jgi:hypothetical protein
MRRVAPPRAARTHLPPCALKLALLCSLFLCPRVQSSDAAFTRLLEACTAADAARTGLLSRQTMEHLLRGAGAAAIADLDAIALLGMLDAAGERAGRAISYPRLLRMLSGVDYESSAVAAAQPLLAAHDTHASIFAPAPAEQAHAAPPPLAPPVLDIYASRRRIEDYNQQTAALLARTATRDGITPKIGARAAVLRPGTPAAVAAEVAPLVVRKHAEAAADAVRSSRVRAAMAFEREAAARSRAESQGALRAALDAQVAARRKALMAV